MDSQDLLQSKADELELERKNVLNLVEVTSAYIKELEGSIEEYKVKIHDLQLLNSSRNGATAKGETTTKTPTAEGARATPRPPPEGSSEVDGGSDATDGLSLSRPAAPPVADDPPTTATESEQVEDMKHLQSILSIKVTNMSFLHPRYCCWTYTMRVRLSL